MVILILYILVADAGIQRVLRASIRLSWLLDIICLCLYICVVVFSISLISCLCLLIALRCYFVCLHFSTCACHPCSGAMLIFPVSFQFQRMIPEGNPVSSLCVILFLTINNICKTDTCFLFNYFVGVLDLVIAGRTRADRRVVMSCCFVVISLCSPAGAMLIFPVSFQF